MFRVTPLYGSTWNKHGSSEIPSCTLIEFGECSILVNFGWYGYHHHTATNFDIPYHDCLILTDSTIQSIGGLPIYYKQMQYQISQQQQQSSSLQNQHSHQQNEAKTKQQQEQHKREELEQENIKSGEEAYNDDPMILDSSHQDEDDDNHDHNIRETKETENDHARKNNQKRSPDVILKKNENETATTNNNSNKNKNKMMTSIPPIYATFPTVKMGQMTLYDQHACICLDGGTPPYTLDDVDQICQLITSIKYSQKIYLPFINTNTKDNNPKEALLSFHDRMIRHATCTVTAHRAGHVVGGAFYSMQRIQDETVVVITESTYHIAKEKHLDSSTLLQYGSTPDVLITKPGGPSSYLLKALYHPQKQYYSMKQQNQTTTTSITPSLSDQPTTANKSSKYIPIPSAILVSNAERTLLEMIMSVLRREGNVLLPVDTSGRVLELLLLLNHYWETQRLSSTYNLIWCSYMCENTIQFARSQLEWMSTSLESSSTQNPSSSSSGIKIMESDKRGNANSNNTLGIRNGVHPFQLRCVRLCTSARQFDALLEELGSNKNAITGGSTTTGTAKSSGSEVNNANPTCVLASGLSLECGPARDIFLKYADDPDNAIIFTDSSQCYLRYMESHMINNNNNNNSAVENSNTKTSMMYNNKTESIHTASFEHSPSHIKEQLPDRTSLTRSTSTSLVVNDDVDNEEVVSGGTNNNNMSNIVNEPSIWTTAGQLMKAWAKAKACNTEMEDSIDVDVRVPYRVPLSGSELKHFLQQEEEMRLRHIAEEEKRAILREVELAKGQLRLGVGSGTGNITDDIDVVTTATTSISATTDPTKSESKSTSMTTVVRPKKKSRFDSTLFVKFSKPLHLTFEIREEPAGIGQPESVPKFGIGESYGRPGEILEDDYGIAVQPERFMDIVSGVDPSKYASGTGRIGDDMKRGFGYGITDASTVNNNNNIASKKKSLNKSMKMISGTSSSARVVSEDEDQDDIDNEYDEQELEALDLSEGTGIIRGRNGRQPIKVCSVYRKVEVLAEISYVPGLEGRVDARAARQSVRALQPREVIVLGGAKKQQDQEIDSMNDADIEIPALIDEVTLLAEAAKSFATGSKNILTPSDGEVAELEIGHAAYSVRLIDTPFVPNIEKEREGYEPPQPIELHETKVGSCSASLLDYVANGQKVAIDGSIVLAPRKQTMPEHWVSSDIDHFHPPVYVSDGEVLLTDLRSELIAQGMKAEYSAHSGYSQLLVNGKIVIRKDAQQQHHDSSNDHHHENNDIGSISIEGPLCEDFYLVRSIVTGQFVVLS